ncbi:hypothetical protein SDC9_164412 [bioreactor metagenome]|uniref:Uncharacterized protein n=1 Tax=bioreactor metagenome TaxID=1076179 RepID=A0A645FYS8_9ZZZZ
MHGPLDHKQAALCHAVADDLQHGTGNGGRGPDGQPQRYVGDLRDRGIGEHPPKILLCDGHYRTADNSHGGEHSEYI